jgi:predicted ATPase
MTQEALKLTLQTLELSKETMKSACKQIDELKAKNKALKEALAQPPQRTWVGLTDEEVYKIAFALEGEHWKKIADAIEAKLKQKNGFAEEKNI